MERNTLITMGACLATIIVLAGIVVWAESRLSSQAKQAAREELAAVKKHRDALAAARKRIAHKISKNPALLRDVAREESWVELFDLAITEVGKLEKEYRPQIEAIVAKNSSEDEQKLFTLLKELETKSQEAEKRVAGLENRIKQLADVLARADKLRVAEEKGLRSGLEAVKSSRGMIQTLEGKYGDEFKALVQKEGWNEKLDREGETLVALQKEFDKDIAPLIKAGSSDKARQAIGKLQRISSKRARAQAEAKLLYTALKALQHYIDHKAEYIQKAKDAVKVVEAIDLRPAQDAAAKAALDFKRVEQRVKSGLALLEQMPVTARRAADAVVAQGELKLTDPAFNPGQVVSDLKQLEELRNTGARQVKDYLALLAQLYVAWDKILSDLRIQEGQVVEFRVQYTVHRVDANDKKTTKKEPWKKISSKEYKELEKKMGMVVESKPKGYFDSEAKKGAIPPGYTYVDNPHYGKWERRGGHRVWIFHRRYHYLRPMFWGSYYRPIRYTHWSTWHAHPRRIYYGRDRFGRVRYGPQGSLTRRHYSGALFVRHGGWRSTRWYRSGGKFRGTRFERRRRSTRAYGGGSGPRYRGSSSYRRSSSYRSYGK